MKKIFKVGFLFFLVLSFSFFAHASGFLIYEHGAAAMAMGGAFIALANNPSAIFHNPAGLAWLDGTQVSLGGTLILPKGSLSLPNWPDPAYQSVDQECQVFYPPSFYLTHKFGDKIAAGIGVFAPYGLGTKWPEDYPLKYIGTSNEMQTIFVNPSLAFKISDNFAVGVGVSYIYSSLSLNLVRLVEIAIYQFDVPASLEKASGSSFGFNAGALYKGEKFSVGVNWRSGFKIKYEGNLKLDSSLVPSAFRGYIPTEGTASTTFNFPHILGAGLSYKFSEKFLVSADIHYILWKTYDKYVVNVVYPAPFGASEPETVEENWKDSFIFRGGFQYQVGEKFSLRAGLLYDQTPQPAESMDPNLPDANRVALTGGFGYKFGRFVIDVAYQYEMFSDRKSPNRNAFYVPAYGINFGEGTYSTTAHLLGVSLGFVF